MIKDSTLSMPFIQNDEKDTFMQEHLQENKFGGQYSNQNHTHNNYGNNNSNNIAQKTLIYLDGTVFPEPTEPNNNLVKNYRYTANTFFPKVSYASFKHFQNLLIVLVVFIQLFPPFTISFYYAVLAPFALLCFMIVTKEQTDDLKRREQNKMLNMQSYKVLTKVGEDTVNCQDIKVGDLLLLGPGQRVPADVILLTTPGEPLGQIFVNCEQIDGKSEIQIRRSVQLSHNYAQHNSLTTLKACVQVDPPQKLINSFTAKFKHEIGGGEDHVEEINIYNTIWANSHLESGKAIGLVVYAGNNTKSQLNWETFHYKHPRLDSEMNRLTYTYFIFFILLALSVSLFTGFDSNWNYQFARNLLMYLSVLPISIRFCLTISKSLLAKRIEADKMLPNIKIQNRNNPENIGRFQFMLCDKTGTITKNHMKFQKIRLLDDVFSCNQMADMKAVMEKQCQFLGMCADLNDKIQLKHRHPESYLRDAITAIGLCNTVIPVSQGVEVTYQASSSDEICMVKMAEKLGIRLTKKTPNVIEIDNSCGKKEIYKVIQTFPFTSEKRKMGMLLNQVESNKYVYIVKGAEDIMKHVVPERQMPFVMEQSEILGNEGLRTMVYAYSYLTRTQFTEWFAKYKNYLEKTFVKDKVLVHAQDELEENCNFLAITGIEEQVDEGVKETFEIIRESGIKTWMVTGDTVATAKQIGILSGFKGEEQEYVTFQNILDEYTISLQLTSLDKKLSISRRIVLVVDNISYKTAIKLKEKYFFDLMKICYSVMFCNFTPSQKASLTLSIKRHFEKDINFIVAVGNGVNDVQMFQKADYSICVSGEKKESNQPQATIASDIRIHQFKDLQRLLQFYGLNIYKRSTVMIAYLVQRGLILATIQAVFSVLFDVQIQIFSPFITMLMSTIFCICPIMCIINHFDYTMETQKKHREIYIYLQKNRELSIKNFMIWSFRAIFQGCFIMVFGVYMFPEHFDLQNVAFLVFVAIELLNFWSEISISFFAIIFQVFQIMLYVAALYLDHGHFEIFYQLVMDKEFMTKIGIIIAATYIPLQILKSLMNSKLPSEYQRVLKVMKEESKMAAETEAEKDKYYKELQEYNQKMEKEWLDEQRKLNPDVENPDYIPPPEPEKQVVKIRGQRQKKEAEKKKKKEQEEEEKRKKKEEEEREKLIKEQQKQQQEQETKQLQSSQKSQTQSQKLASSDVKSQTKKNSKDQGGEEEEDNAIEQSDKLQNQENQQPEQNQQTQEQQNQQDSQQQQQQQ